jgi:hypothetical protein
MNAFTKTGKRKHEQTEPIGVGASVETKLDDLDGACESMCGQEPGWSMSRSFRAESIGTTGNS